MSEKEKLISQLSVIADHYRRCAKLSTFGFEEWENTVNTAINQLKEQNDMISIKTVAEWLAGYASPPTVSDWFAEYSLPQSAINPHDLHEIMVTEWEKFLQNMKNKGGEVE